jgi:predicted transcriptional regulator
LTAVMSIRSQHAARIYSGDKRFEFRRRRPRFLPGLKVYIYEPLPVRAVTGHFRVASVADIKDLDSLESDEDARNHVQLYLRGAHQPTAIEITGVTELDVPMTLEHFGVSTAPQSYIYIGTK